jgi:hypothetical protein
MRSWVLVGLDTYLKELIGGSHGHHLGVIGRCRPKTSIVVLFLRLFIGKNLARVLGCSKN